MNTSTGKNIKFAEKINDTTNYKTSYSLKTKLFLKPINEIIELYKDSIGLSYRFYDFKLSIILPNNTVRTLINEGSTTGGSSASVVLDNLGTYVIQYEGQTYQRNTLPGQNDEPGTKFILKYQIAVVENRLPLKRWTITDVINRLFDVAEPIRKGESPRFRLNAEQAQKFDKILSPEFSFTKQTLRECLQQIGGFVHGEPRLKPVKDYVKKVAGEEKFSDGRTYIGSNNIAPYERGVDYFVIINGTQYSLRLDSEANGGDDDYYFIIDGVPDYNGTTIIYTMSKDKVWIYEVNYEMFAGEENSDIQYLPYDNKGQQHIIDYYLATVDSSAENLVNQLDKLSGVVVEPYDKGAKSVRTENLYVRIEEGNMLIPTQYPIYSIEKLEYVAELYDEINNRNILKSVDITPYVFEKSEYDGRLSSFEGVYPYSKMYALYFTQGSKNIGGLNFKVPSASATAAPYKDYAITNILKEATGNSDLELNYPQMCFRVTYTPFYNARVGQTKAYYKDFKRPAALIYNQTSNLVESRAYGENLKGVAARLGNLEMSLTYNLRMLYEVARAGLKFNDQYYISAVATEILPTMIKSTVGLSKDFNRLSQYIGVSSVKRYYEVSQTQAVERNTLYREYIVIGEQEERDKDALTGDGMLLLIGELFEPPKDNDGELIKVGPITNVVAWGESYSGTKNTAVNLPVITSAFGNSISFSWKYEDNYSAGAMAQYQSNDKVKGYFQQSLPYGDYYGRLYYYNFDLQLAGTPSTLENYEQIGLELPKGAVPKKSSQLVSTVGKTPYIMRKDNREALQVNFQIDFVTNLENMIIGSALASYCPAVRGTDDTITPKLYVFPTELNKFTNHVEAFEDVDLSKLPSEKVSITLQDGYLIVTADSFPASGKSWAIVTAQRSVTQTVESEDGMQTEQTTYYGGDLLLGQNIEVTAGQAFTPIYFTIKREIFDKSVWKDRF